MMPVRLTTLRLTTLRLTTLRLTTLCLTTAVLFAVLAVPAPGLSQPGPVCASPEVLDQVARIIAATGSTARIELVVGGQGVAGLAGLGQAPAAQPHTVACAVRLFDWAYDTSRHGLVPQPRERTYAFTVRRGRNALFVQPLSVE